MQISMIEALKFTEKVLFERKKKYDKGKHPKFLYYTTLVEHDPLKKLKKKLAGLEKKYEVSEKRFPVLAKRLLKSAMSVTKKIEVQQQTLVAR